MKRYKIYSLVIPVLFSYLPSIQADTFANFDKEMKIYNQSQSNSNQKIKEFKEFKKEYLKEYDQWRTQYLSEFDQYQAQIIKKWGRPETGKNVHYSKDSNLKSTIDYEKNEVLIEMLVDKSLSKNDYKKLLSQRISTLLKNKSSNLSILSAKGITAQSLTTSIINYSKQNEETAKKIVLHQTIVYLQDIDKQADQLLFAHNTISTAKLQMYVVAEKEKIKKEAFIRLKKIESYYTELRGDSGKLDSTQFKTVKYTLNLPQNSLAKRAKQYVPLAEAESKRFDIPAALVMAIMHSESSFDPKAKSAVPAFGLMQIVPRTAGHDVNKLIRNIDRPMTSAELYNPAVNVETGSAYLSILYKRYLKSIKNPTSRLYCTIAAYNTGAGNVASAFNKKGSGSSRNINNAAKIINQLSPKEVYNALMKKLPYDETKHYLEKVSNRINLYQVKL